MGIPNVQKKEKMRKRSKATPSRPNVELKRLRKQRGLSQEALAASLKFPVTSDSIKNWENGERPNPFNRKQLCDFFNVTEEELWPKPKPPKEPDQKRRRIIQIGIGIAGLAGGGYAA